MKHLREIFKLDNNVEGTQNFNLHNHTFFSDGEHTVRQLCKNAVEEIITHVSITDHDSIDAYTTGGAMKIARGFGINMIPGVEATIKDAVDNNKILIHMLLYFDEKLLKDKMFLNDFRESIGKVRSRELVIEKITALNNIYELELQGSDIEKYDNYGGFAGFSRQATSRMFFNIIKEKYPYLSNKKIRKMVSWDSPAYVKFGSELSDIIYLKNKYDLASVLAHPYRYKGLEPEQTNEFIKNLISLGELDGLEAHYSKHSEKQVNILKKYPVELFTGGSDTHYHKGDGLNTFKDLKIHNIENKDFEVLNRKGELGVLTGRMNPIHIGHIRVIKKALRENGKVILFLGSINKIDQSNPFSYEDRILFLNTYFKKEITRGELIISGLEDQGNNKRWTKILGKKIKELSPGFNGKLNFYGGDINNDRAINAITENEKLLKFKNINYREIVRNDFDVLHNKERHKISATALRHALENQDYELAKKFLPNSIGELVIAKWKENNEEFIGKNFFFIYPPEFDKQGNIHRNYKQGANIKNQIVSNFNDKYISNDIEKSDIIVPVGGDGSLLRAIKTYGHLGKPFFPIASGTKNFIPAKFNNPYDLLTEEIEELNFELLNVDMYGENGENLGEMLAMNDIFLEVKRGTMGMLVIEGDDYPIRKITGNGVIVSTTVGSTAYNKNANGIRLPLNNDILAITDIASDAGISDGIDANQSIEIDVIRGEFNAYVDGVEVKNVFKVGIKKSGRKVKIILPKNNEFRKNRYK